MMTLDEVARLCGVSRSTVSRVINNNPNVSAPTRHKVLRVIQETHFEPNLVARSLAAGRTRMLGLLIPRAVTTLFHDPYFPTVIQGVASACNAHEFSVMLWLAEPEYERRMARQVLNATLADGVIVASAQLDDPILAALMDHHRPFLVIGRHPSSEQVSYVDVDNRAGARLAVNHLIGLGRRRIATIAGPQNLAPGIDRRLGYEDALAQAGIAHDPRLVREGDFTDESGYAAMRELLPQRPDAVFAASDIMAIAAMRAIHEAGMQVPADIAVVGFDDVDLAARANPTLTTIRQPVHQSGVIAAETLIQLIDEPQCAPRQIILPTELVVRASCGAKLSIAHSPTDQTAL